jgi:hypothetical protein
MATQNTRDEIPSGWKDVSRRRLAWLFVIALVPRLAFGLIPADRESGDQGQYLDLAHNLRAYATFGIGPVPTVRRAPLYPMILAAIGTTGTLALQVFAGSMIAPLTFVIASESLPPTGALAAGLGMALAPMSAKYCTLFMTETLFTFLLVFGAFFWIIPRPVIAGICFGLAALLRPVLLPLLIVLPLLTGKRAWRSTLIISASALAVVAPWSLRNVVEAHRFVPIATAGWGSNLFQGTLHVPSGDPWPFIMQQRAGDTEEGLLRRGLDRIWRNPLDWLAVRVEQYPKLYLNENDYFGPWLKYLYWAGNIALLVLAALGYRRTQPGPQIWVYPAFTAVSQLPMWTEARYSLPMIPFLLILAGGFSIRRRT